MPDPNVTRDLNTMSKAELQALRRRVEGALMRVDARRRREAISAARRSVEEFGLSLEEVLAFGPGAGRLEALGPTTGQTAKFRNPQNPQETWVGRGRRPAWLNRQLGAGKSSDDFRV